MGWSRLAQTLANERGERALCEAVSRVIVEGFGFSRALIATIEGRDGDARLLARGAYDPAIGMPLYMALLGLYRLPLTPDSDGKLPITVWCALHREQVHILDAERYDFHPEASKQQSFLVRALGTKEYVLTPIVCALHDHAVGVLAVDKKGQGQPITSEEKELLSAICSTLALRLCAHGLSQRRSPKRTADPKASYVAYGTAVEHPTAESTAAGGETDFQPMTGYLSMLVHDLKAPMQSIIGYAELLATRRVGELNTDQIEYVSRIERGGEKMLGLVDSLLECAELEGERITLQRELVDPEWLVEEVIDRLAGKAMKAEVSLLPKVAPDLPAVPVDPERLVEALQNVVDNAIEASDAGSSVRIRVALEPINGKSWLSFDVADEGRGLSEEEAVHMFEKRWSGNTVFRSSGKKHGLGLVITRLLIEAHGGEIRVERRPDKGTLVRLRLPLQAE